MIPEFCFPAERFSAWLFPDAEMQGKMKWRIIHCFDLIFDPSMNAGGTGVVQTGPHEEGILDFIGEISK